MTALYDERGRMIGAGRLPFTAEQADAIARRDGSLLLSANAGSGKTSVLAERFVRSVLEDGLEPGRILAITFTDKAAGELRSRVRGRFVELGRRDRARDLEAAWISTFHGLCARVLRSHAVRAGLDPAFTVLDEAHARELRAAAFERALAELLSGDRSEAVDLVAAYGVDPIQSLVAMTHDQLRSAGQTRPALPTVRAAPPDLRALRAALHAAEAELPADDARRSVAAARAALARCALLLQDPLPALDDLEAAAFKPGNTAILAGPGCLAYLDALAVFADGWHDARAARAVALLDELLGCYADAYADGKRARAALDFDDLELLARDLLRDAPAVRAAYAQRFESVMVDEFQDTNAVQLELLELLGGRRFVVGDELQSIYGFRHADVKIFRGQREALAAVGAAAELAANFRSRPAILAVLDAALGPLHGPAHVPFAAGRSADGQPATPLVELILTDAVAAAHWPEDTLASLPAAPAWRRAEARVLAARVAALVRDEGVAAGDVVVLLRSATAMAVYERALEEQGLSTLAAGGRGYWGRQQVLDLCAHLGALANPCDELSLFGVLASPLVGVSADGLAIVARAARSGGRWDALAAAFVAGEPFPTQAAASQTWVDGLPDGDRDRLAVFCPWFAAERAAAPRRGLDELLERVVDRTGYDLHVLGLPGGRRRWANVLKLQRLAAAFEARRGRDVRGLIDLATAELEAQAREADAPVDAVPDGGGAGAVRLMTIHAAKGLEFPVVVVADLGRAGPRDVADLLVDGDRVGLRLRTVEGASAKALGWQELRDARLAADAQEERRILHVAMTRARERLLLSGAFEPDRWLSAPQAGVAPVRWLAPRMAAGLAAALGDGEQQDTIEDLDPDAGAPVPRVRVAVHRQPPATAGLGLAPVAAEAPGPGHAEPSESPADGQLTLALEAVGPPLSVGRPSPPDAGFSLPGALSYSSLADYARCPYRWYLERVLGLPREAAAPAAADASARPGATGLDPLLRGTLAHELLEELDFAAPAPPPEEAVRATAARHDAELTADDVVDLQRLVSAFADGPLAARLAAAGDVRREHGFVIGLGDDTGPLLTGVIDVLAFESGGGALIVDYKSDVVALDADLDAHVEADYGAQRRIYALAALGAGATDVEVAHLFLARPDQPAVAVFDRADVPALRADVASLVAELRVGGFAPTDRPHRSLCSTCPGRRALCHHPEDLTMRPEPEPIV